MTDSKVVLLEWPRMNAHVEMTPEAQLRLAKENVARFLADIAPVKYPGEAITVAFAFGGFVPSKLEAR